MSFRSLRENRIFSEEESQALIFNRNDRKCRAHSAPIANDFEQEDINARDDEGKTALFCAAKYGETKLAKYLLEGGADPDIATKGLTYPIHEAIDNADIDVVQLLINYGCDINCKNFLGQTPLFRAALFGDIETTKLLIKSGADLDCVDFTGKSAILVALQNGHGEICSLLIRKGCNVNIVGGQGQSALFSLVHRKQKYSINMCQKLVKAGYHFENDFYWLSKELHRSIINTGFVSSMLRKIGFEKLKIEKDDRSGILNDKWFHDSRSRVI